MGISLIIDDDKNVSNLEVDKVARTASDGLTILLTGDVDVLYLDHYLNGGQTGLDIFSKFLSMDIDVVYIPKEIYLISSSKYKNVHNLVEINKTLENLKFPVRYGSKRIRVVPINGQLKSIRAYLENNKIIC